MYDACDAFDTEHAAFQMSSCRKKLASFFWNLTITNALIHPPICTYPHLWMLVWHPDWTELMSVNIPHRSSLIYHRRIHVSSEVHQISHFPPCVLRMLTYKLLSWIPPPGIISLMNAMNHMQNERVSASGEGAPKIIQLESNSKINLSTNTPWQFWGIEKCLETLLTN